MLPRTASDQVPHTRGVCGMVPTATITTVTTPMALEAGRQNHQALNPACLPLPRRSHWGVLQRRAHAWSYRMSLELTVGQEQGRCWRSVTGRGLPDPGACPLAASWLPQVRSFLTMLLLSRCQRLAPQCLPMQAPEKAQCAHKQAFLNSPSKPLYVLGAAPTPMIHASISLGKNKN